jgi:aerobic-type carbon monoxide dehydrogenase small subunit (CoxS/CutS family)
MSQTIATSDSEEMRVVRFMLNGEEVEVDRDHPHLLAALREELDVTSPKDGCSPMGQCGCCTVLIDGKASVSCLISLDKAAGKSIVTLEGVEPDERARYAAAFAATGALQCGFCTPGMVLTVLDLVSRCSNLSEADVRTNLSGNICRCTGYQFIVDAALAAARELGKQRQS